MNPDRRDAVTDSIQAWVETISSSNPTKEKVMHDENTPKLSKKAADTLFGQPASSDFDRDLYELQKLADQVLMAVAANEAQETAFRGARETLPYRPPRLDLTMPMPSWPES